MSRKMNEFTPLLVHDTVTSSPPPHHYKSSWQFILAGVLSLGILSLLQHENSVPLDFADVAVSFNETRAGTNDTDDVVFLSNMETFKDLTVDPCVDFYEYACGGWLKSHEIPADRPSIDSSFYVVSESNKDMIQQIFNQNPPQIGPFYHSCLRNDELDTKALGFVTQLVNNVHQVNSTLALMELAGKIDQMLGISTFLSLSVDADPHNSTQNILSLSQGGLTLPSREYYLEQSKVDTYAALYVNYVTKVFAVGDLDHHNVSEFAEAVLKIETAFANMSLPNAALRDPWTTTTAYPFAEIAQRYPFIMAYLNGIYKQEPFPMLHAIIATPDFFKAQNEFLSDEALLPQLKNYLSFHLVDSLSIVLGEYYRRVSHDFHGKAQGSRDLVPRNQFCMRLTTAFLGDELGKYYMQSVFGPDAKKAAEALVLEIEESLKTLLLTEKWLDKVTYDAAVEKLSKVKNYIGGPDDVPPLPFELQADAFFDNVKKLMQLGAARAIQSVGKPVDEKAWNMFPSTVNAYYDPSANKMVFPAAILQPPFYSADHFPVAANFARIGMVMGHELSHGFDDQGRNYDSIGSLRSWWTPSVSAKFAEKAKCLAAQYSKFPVVSTEDNSVLGTVNGNLTLGENIADNGGIRLAYEAYHLWKSTFESPPIVPSSKVPPETGNPKPVAVSSPDKLGPKPTHSVPSGDIPAVTAAPHLPVSVPAPTKAGPSGHNPVVPVPPPVLPGPGAATPEATQTEPNGGVSVISKPPLVPESQPAGVGPGEVIPHKNTPAPGLPSPAEQTPAPSRQESATKAPTVTPVSPKLPDVPNNPTPPPVSDVPNTPNTPSGSTPPTVPDVPHTPSSPNILPPSKVPAVVPQPQPQPGDVSPDNASKDKRTKKEDEPSAKPEKKDHTEKQKRQESEDETGKPDSKVADDNSHVSRDKSKHKSEDRKNKGENDDHAKRSTGDDGKVDRYEHRKHENKEERREERKERKKERKEHRHHEKEKHRYHHDEEKHRYHHDEEKHRYHHDEEYHGHHHKREKEGKDEKEYHECRKEDADCGSERPTWTLSESKYPFSGGDTRMQSMVMKLARAIVYPNDPVADDRLFFTAFAQNWCEKRTPGYAELLRMLDPHSPGKWRVNGPLMNYDKFAKAFSCSLGTPMNPEKKCVVW